MPLRATRANTEARKSPCYKSAWRKQYELQDLPDSDLLLKLADVLKQSRRVESVLLAHIAEVDARGLFVRQASSSMHKYCTDVLYLSGAEAFLRITAARASRRYPVLLKMLDDGRLHLSGLAVLAPHLTNSNCVELLARATTRPRVRSRSWWQRSRRSRMWRLPSGSFRNDKSRMGKNYRKGKVRSKPTKTLRQAPEVLRPERVLRLVRPHRSAKGRVRISRRSSNRWDLHVTK